MSDDYVGGCLCGAVRYKAAGGPLFQMNCHCRDCQRWGGGAYAPVLAFKKGQLALEGDVRFYESEGGSGSAIQRGFCATCGASVTLKVGREFAFAVVTAASLDDPARFQPSDDIFTAHAHPWDHMSPELGKHDGFLKG